MTIQLTAVDLARLRERWEQQLHCSCEVCDHWSADKGLNLLDAYEALLPLSQEVWRAVNEAAKPTRAQVESALHEHMPILRGTDETAISARNAVSAALLAAGLIRDDDPKAGAA